MEQEIKITQTTNADMNIGVPKNCHISSNNSDTKQITMAQQTAINWLREKLQETYDKEGKLPLAYTFSLLNKAEQMEKQQHDNTWVDSRIEDRGEGFIGKEKTFEQYYNETYGSNNKI